MREREREKCVDMSEYINYVLTHWSNFILLWIVYNKFKHDHMILTKLAILRT